MTTFPMPRNADGSNAIGLPHPRWRVVSERHLWLAVQPGDWTEDPMGGPLDQYHYTFQEAMEYARVQAVFSAMMVADAASV